MTKTTGTVRRRYEAMARDGALRPDADQIALAEALDGLHAQLERPAEPKRSGALGFLGRRRAAQPRARGLYIWGPVGRGKTLLMDIFFEAVASKRKRRAHFHAFMADMHERINAVRASAKSEATAKNGKVGKRVDPIVAVADGLAAEISLLCFDEFSVTDIADAMILGRLFGALFERGVVLVATTNVAPDDLYKGGLNRALFLPFIALLKSHMTVFHLDAPRDYRLDAGGGEPRYATPLGDAADACLDAHFLHLTGMARGERREIHHKGRRIVVPQAAAGVARFSFEELCGRPLGAGDYLKLAEAFHTFIVADVPVLSATRRNEAKRLINLVDTLYDRRARLIVSAETEPFDLYEGKEGTESFEFQRTASRLVEMRSDAYWREASASVTEDAPSKTKKAQAVKPGPLE